MKRLTNLSVGWHGLLEAVGLFVESWKPLRCACESEYRDQLATSLRDSVPDDVRVESEYRDRGTTIDLWIRWPGILISSEVAIEIKLDLRKKTEFDRLVGQIESLDPVNRNVLVALIGDCDPAFPGRLREKYRPAPLLFAQKTFRIAQVAIG